MRQKASPALLVLLGALAALPTLARPRTVLDETRLIEGVLTRAIEEIETLDGAITSDVYLFGAESTIPADDESSAGGGTWTAGRNGARAGMAMPGSFLLGARYQIEQAPGVARGRAENVATGVSVITPFGRFDDCVATIESSPLEPGEEAAMVYAEGIGRVADEELRLVDWTPAPAQGH